MFKKRHLASIVCLSSIFNTTLAAQSPQDSSDLNLHKTKSSISIPGTHEFGARTRYQTANDDWWQDGTAFTTRIKLTSQFKLDQNEKWRLLLQPNYVFIHDDNYNSISNFNFKSVIPDTKGGSLTQGFLAFNTNNNWQFKLGRQSISYDNERMIGALEYWQTPQSFDAISAQYNDSMNWDIQYAYVDKVNRIFGKNAKTQLQNNDPRNSILIQRPKSELGVHNLNAHFLNLGYKTENDLSLVAYNYLIDNQDQDLFSSNTIGIKISDEFKPKSIKYRFHTEFAWQEDAYNNNDNYQAWYNLIEASIQYKSHILKLSQETLSEDNGVGFKTSLGTNHKFQGWADIFTSYGGQNGLRDTFITYRGRHKKLRWRAVYHNFNTYGNSQSLGYEIDVEIAYRLTRQWEAKIVYADYNAQDKWIPEHLGSNFDLSTWFISVSYNI